MLQPWSPGELVARDGCWDAAELLSELGTRLPDGASPEPLPVATEKVGGAYVPKP